ncbi:hypothetical protein KGF56_004372 [Candida oxycetoniae]|uniref:Uncharacterized protein n=1 Tax=Candida oxycetoniae TaxID=497107 RepID=A0AAI9STT0_9ASCO|nr:uncharacterized protein KGF56_004372 [Candida oxycetoniae]KAI3402911.2 hypothetical protein KGF56_004372 [Candida oxycetoniae]
MSGKSGQNNGKSKLEHYRKYLQDNGFPHEHLLSDNKEPGYIVKHHDQAYLKLGLQDNYRFNDHQQPYHMYSLPFASSSINFNNSVISHAFYLFMTMISAVIILAALMFGIREYLVVLNGKARSAHGDGQKLSEWNLANLKSDAKEDELQSLDKVIQDGEKLQIEDSEDSGLTKFNDGFENVEKGGDDDDDQNQNHNHNQWTTPRKYNLQSNIVSPVSTISEKNTVSNTTAGFSDKSITKYRKKYLMLLPNMEQQQKHLYGSITQRYSIEEMMKLRVQKPVTDLSFNTSSVKQKVRMSQVLSSSIKIPATRFRNAWNASKMVVELKLTLLQAECKVEKILAILQLCSIAKAYSLLDNPTIFLHAFNECIEEIVDSGAVFELMFICTATLKTLLTECLLSYCWSHAKFHDYEAKNSQIKQQFKKWNIHSPLVQTKATVFKILCNLQLGMYTVGQSQNDCELKLGLLVRTFINQSQCNDYINYLPLIAKAVDVADRDEIVYFFYQITKFLVLKHGKCCMGEYIQDANLDLKTLVQYGMQIFHSERVRRKTQEIYTILRESHPIVESWKPETIIANQEKNATTTTTTVLPLSSEYAERYFTPTIKEEKGTKKKDVEFENYTPDSWKMGLLTSRDARTPPPALAPPR